MEKMITPTDLCCGFHNKFSIFLSHICPLCFNDKLDYSYVHKLLRCTDQTCKLVESTGQAKILVPVLLIVVIVALIIEWLTNTFDPGDIYLRINIISEKKVGIKYESVKAKHPQLEYESKILLVALECLLSNSSGLSVIKMLWSWTSWAPCSSTSVIISSV